MVRNKKKKEAEPAASGIGDQLERLRGKIRTRSGLGREDGLSHKEVIDMVPRYLSDDLSDAELIAFLRHINGCRDCYEELETMFMVDRTIHYLDDGEDGSFDLTPELLKDMERKIHRVRVNRFFARLRRITAVCAFGLFSLAVLDFFGIFPITRLL